MPQSGCSLPPREGTYVVIRLTRIGGGILAGHTVVEDWMGEQVRTLEDLWPQSAVAVVVGINPAPVSVDAGHYYKGQLGQRLWDRLRLVGLLGGGVGGPEDDAAVAAGVGFTDIVKRPTPGADAVRPEEFRYGRTLVRDKLVAAGAPLVIFSFKEAAKRYFDRKVPGNGFVPGLKVGPASVFVMPGPYEGAATATATLDTLRQRLARA
jgi:double-stranded uracil-DNA glycosylase